MTIHQPPTQPRTLGPQFAELADDTEESILGSSLHQGAITTLHDGLDACGHGRGLPWFVGNQIRMVIPRVGRRAASLSPDICVHPTLGTGSRDSIIVAADGPPALVIEIASPSTAAGRDLAEDTPRAKPAAYAALGIPEYLVFDPVGEFVTTHLWARKLGPDGYIPWEPEADGRWHSALGIAFTPQGSLLRVYDQDGQLVPTGPELRHQIAEQERRLADRDRRLADRERRIADRDRRIAALEAELRRLRGE
ncbi:MAG TPA: Uma2 family endonuclease [Thermomicrobiales bacterium]|jgi:Uma2 family endonuclease